MRILLLNDHYFGDTFRMLGAEVLRVGPSKKDDIVIDPASEDLTEVLNNAGFAPDIVLQVDSIDRRCFFHGLERFDVPRVFYSIDTPINEFWQKSYAHAFDRVYVDQYETWRSWAASGLDWARWLPLAADPALYHTPDGEARRDIPIVFVGTLNPDVRPKRNAILFRIQQIAPVKVVDGDGSRAEPGDSVAGLYRRAKIVLNELLFDGINLRTFEAMACGAVVITERDRGEKQLFTDGKQLVTFDSVDLEQVVSDLLDDENRVEQIGKEGAKTIRGKHTIAHRAAQVMKDIESLKVRKVRNTEAAAAEAAWGVWQATWKWEYLKNYRSGKGKILFEHLECLDPVRRAQVLEAKGDLKAAAVSLGNALEINPDDVSIRAALAGIVLGEGDSIAAGKLLNCSGEPDMAEAHIAVGNLLMEAGDGLTPGFNRAKSPVSGWNAFEHYLRAHALNEDNREALEGLDKVLIAHRSPEFMIGLWQRFHARNPRDERSMIKFRQRAMAGYFRPGRYNKGERMGSGPFPEAKRATEGNQSSVKRPGGAL